MSTHNICFRRQIRKIFCGYPLLSVAMFSVWIPSFCYKGDVVYFEYVHALLLHLIFEEALPFVMPQDSCMILTSYSKRHFFVVFFYASISFCCLLNIASHFPPKIFLKSCYIHSISLALIQECKYKMPNVRKGS